MLMIGNANIRTERGVVIYQEQNLDHQFSTRNAQNKLTELL